MSNIFLCGPLAHRPLLEIVLGRRIEPPELTAAKLHDFAVFQVTGQPYAIVRQTPGAEISGWLVRGLEKNEFARLAYYQAGFGFQLASVSPESAGGGAVQAQVYISQTELGKPGERWSQADWVARWGDIAQSAAREIMAQFGQLDGAQIMHRLPGLHLRAASWVAARARPGDDTRDLARDVVVHAHHHTYSNFFAAQEMDLQYRRYDGDLSPVMNRGAQILGQAAVVLPYDPVQDAVLMVEQFRAPLYMGGDRAPWLWQPVAGLIDPGETPETAAHREAMEEAGLTLTQLYPVAGVYSSAGANSDFVNLFVGLGDFSSRQAGGGLAEEGEDILVRIVGFDELMTDIDKGRYRDMQLVLTSLWLARHRDRLRQAH